MTFQQPLGNWPFDNSNAARLEHKLEKLEKFVDETVLTMAESLGLSKEEALKVLIDANVEMIRDLRRALESNGNGELIRSAGPKKLCKEIEHVFKEISRATALDTEEISHILATHPDTDIGEISYHLHRRSLIHRSYTS